MYRLRHCMIKIKRLRIKHVWIENIVFKDVTQSDDFSISVHDQVG